MKRVFHKWKPFHSLYQVVGLFEQVKVDIGGYAVIWNDDLDLACNELYNNGDTV